MTKKRFKKLLRAYFTRLNEWAKQNGGEPMDMGKVYRTIQKGNGSLGMSRDEWWKKLSEIGTTFGVGVKAK